jgi:phosphoglucosamine mutase
VSLFGTDGVRGLANVDLTAELALDLSVAAAHVLSERGVFAGHRPFAIVGRDPRASGEFLEAAVVAGLASAGIDVVRVGVLPTPAVAWLTASRGADLGVMLSASHNPMPDNGIKFFARGGHKLHDDLEAQIEARMREPWERPTGQAVGRVRDDDAALDEYVDAVVATAPARLDGMTLVVDGANGAASVTSARAFERLGAQVVLMHCEPDGLNINESCGSTHPEALQQAVVSVRADAGIAHDGDADRCLAVDADGNLVDGDQILTVLALAMRRRGTLRGDTVVSTVMANEGFRTAMRAHGIAYLDTAVGDRYVLEAMRSGGYNLGGEQSGHVVLLDHATTGDGLLTAVHLLGEVAASGRPLRDLAGEMIRLPQVLVNVGGVDKAGVTRDAVVSAAVQEATAELAGTGRVLLRPSGTEPVVRVMVEAPSESQASQIAGRIASLVTDRLSLVRR